MSAKAGSTAKLARASIVFGIGGALVRGLSFLMLPVYTRWLTPADYGITGLATSMSAVMAVIVTLGLNGALTRFWFTTGSELERRRRSGTLFVAVVCAALLLTALADASGSVLGSKLFRSVPWSPYLRVAVWTTFLGVFSLFPAVFFQVTERPIAFLVFSLAQSVVTIASVVVLVVIFEQGAVGYLRGLLLGAGLMVIPSLLVVRQHVSFTIDTAVLREALKFGLPLVPHNLGAWLLDYVDRVILEKNVSLEDLGIYSLGYQVGTVMYVATSAINAAWTPHFYRAVEGPNGPDKPALARQVSLIVAVLCFGALGVSTIGVKVVAAVVGPSFAQSTAVVPWIVLGYLFSGLYIVPGHFLFAMKKTGAIPLITLVAAGTNIALNLALVPTFGIMAACWATAASYALMLVGYLFIGMKVFPFPFEWGQIAKTLALGAVLFGLSRFAQWPLANHERTEIAVLLATLVLFPVGLVMLGVVTRDEAGKLRDLVMRRVAPSRAM